MNNNNENSKKRTIQPIGNQVAKKLWVDLKLANTFDSDSETETDVSSPESEVINILTEPNNGIFFSSHNRVSQIRSLNKEYIKNANLLFSYEYSEVMKKLSQHPTPFIKAHRLHNQLHLFPEKFVNFLRSIKLNIRRVDQPIRPWVWEMSADVNDMAYLYGEFRTEMKKIGKIISDDKFYIIFDHNSSRISEESPAYIDDIDWEIISNKLNIDASDFIDYGSHQHIAIKLLMLVSGCGYTFYSRFSFREMFSLYSYILMNPTFDKSEVDKLLLDFFMGVLPENCRRAKTALNHIDRHVTFMKEMFNMISDGKGPRVHGWNIEGIFRKVHKVALNYLENKRNEDAAVFALSQITAKP